MSIDDALRTRAGGRCELCEGQTELQAVPVPPGDAAVAVCGASSTREATWS